MIISFFRVLNSLINLFTYTEWAIIQEVKNVNTKVFHMWISGQGGLTQLYGVDRQELDCLSNLFLIYKAISRYLQGYEVIMMAVIAYNIMLLAGQVISLEHDGVLSGVDNPVYKEIKKGFLEKTRLWPKHLRHLDVSLTNQSLTPFFITFST